MKIVIWPNKNLLKPCEDVTEFNEDLKKISDEMIDILKKSGGIGLAANQVGLNIKLLVAQMGDPAKENGLKYVTFVNPEIVGTNFPLVHTIEGCLSLPGVQASLNIRSTLITVSAYNLEGMPFQTAYFNRDAVILAHEIDHLFGKTLMEHMHGVKKMMAVKKIKKFSKRAGVKPIL
jgi:peptide deformylase